MTGDADVPGEKIALIKCADPGFTATDLNQHRGYRTVEQAAVIAVRLATLGPDGPTGTFQDENGTVP